MTSGGADMYHGSAMNLSGKVALVVGGYGAIGTSISEAIAAAGAKCIVAGRHGDRSRTLAEELCAREWDAAGVELDASNVQAVRDLTDSLAEEHGTIDILVNCVGFHNEQTLLEVTEEAFDEAYLKTLRVSMFLAQAVAKHQIQAGKGGSHIHLTSLRAAFAVRDRGYSAFCAMKSGVRGLVLQHAVELGRHGIRVNAISPCVTATRKNLSLQRSSQILEGILAGIPLGRLAQPSDIADACVFLASASSRFVTGHTLVIDGGMSAALTY
ncbi:SDR family oxidoreductase [Sinorhizobium medicae]|nr:SDR family oxidoreductase [Sinorhizobium medicae]